MPFNGSGSFIPLSAPTYPAVAGQPIYASQFNDNIDDIQDGLSGCITRDGQTTITANLPMAGFKFTGLGDGSANGHALVYGQATAASLGGALAITGALSGVTTLAASGNATVGGTLGVTGLLTGSAGVAVGGALSGATTGAFSSNVTIGGTLGVTGVASFASDLAIGDDLTVTNTATIGGTLSGSTGSFSGNLVAVDGVFAGSVQFSSSQAVCDGGGATLTSSLPLGTIIAGAATGSMTGLDAGETQVMNGSTYIETTGPAGASQLIQYGTWRCLGRTDGSANLYLWVRIG